MFSLFYLFCKFVCFNSAQNWRGRINRYKNNSIFSTATMVFFIFFRQLSRHSYAVPAVPVG